MATIDDLLKLSESLDSDKLEKLLQYAKELCKSETVVDIADSVEDPPVVRKRNRL